MKWQLETEREHAIVLRGFGSSVSYCCFKSGNPATGTANVRTVSSTIELPSDEIDALRWTIGVVTILPIVLGDAVLEK